MNCIIIDDEATARSVLKKLCYNVADLKVVKEFDSASEALAYLRTKKIDLIFLDLHMPDLNGYNFLDQLIEHPKIILTTTDRSSAITAFEYKCIIDYLGKPLKFSRFLHALDKVKRAIKISEDNLENLKKLVEPEDLYVNISRKLVKISLNSIEFIKTHPRGIEVRTHKQNYIVKSSLSKISERLPHSNFIKVHQSYIINLAKIKDIKKNMVLINQENVPISRTNKSELFRRINLF